MKNSSILENYLLDRAVSSCNDRSRAGSGYEQARFNV
jgi:hypothetical protein